MVTGTIIRSTELCFFPLYWHWNGQDKLKNLLLGKIAFKSKVGFELECHDMREKATQNCTKRERERERERKG